MSHNDDFIKREGEDIIHVEHIDTGGYGEVHKVQDIVLEVKSNVRC